MSNTTNAGANGPPLAVHGHPASPANAKGTLITNRPRRRIVQGQSVTALSQTGATMASLSERVDRLERVAADMKAVAEPFYLVARTLDGLSATFSGGTKSLTSNGTNSVSHDLCDTASLFRRYDSLERTARECPHLIAESSQTDCGRIETPDRDAWRDIAIAFDPKRALRQIASGLRHLHGLKLVHRDIKPQNILVSAGTGRGVVKSYRMLISDFGLCKKLDIDQTSFLPTSHGAQAAGTVGWRASEILRGDVKLDEVGSSGDDTSVSSQGSVASGVSSGTAGKPTRLTKSVDIFALGCLFFYMLTNGSHPFGDRYEREANIMKDAKNLKGLERFGEEGEEAVDLIDCMLHAEAHRTRRHASDRFEIMCRDPKDPYLVVLEKGAFGIIGNDWLSRLDRLFIENLGKFRKYDGKSVQDLLRALRNKKHHYQDLPDNVKRHGPMPEGFLAYFTRRYP